MVYGDRQFIIISRANFPSYKGDTLSKHSSVGKGGGDWRGAFRGAQAAPLRWGEVETEERSALGSDEDFVNEAAVVSEGCVDGVW